MRIVEEEVITPMRESVLEESHVGSMGGHLGEAKTLNHMKENFFMQTQLGSGARLTLNVQQESLQHRNNVVLFRT